MTWHFLAHHWKAIVSFFFLPVLGNVFAGELRDLIYTQFGWKEPASYLWWTMAISGVLCLGIAIWTIYAGRDLFFRNIALGPRRNPEPHPHLVLFLSNLPTDRVKFNEGVPDGLILAGDLAVDLEDLARRKDPKRKLPDEKDPRWSWEMPLRGLFQHRTALKTVTLVCSKESLLQAHWFARLLSERYKTDFPHLQPSDIRLLVRDGAAIRLSTCTPALANGGDPAALAWDFEDYDDLYAGLSRMMDHFQKEGKREKEVMIDVTGGQKPNSVVGALLTVNRRAKFQYVQTNHPNDVIAYDLMTDALGS